MSRYHFRVGKVAVQTGWDGPLQHYFLRVVDGNKTIYDNLADASLSWGEMNLAQVREVMGRLSVTTPPDLFTRLEADQAASNANHVHDYGTVGAESA